MKILKDLKESPQRGITIKLQWGTQVKRYEVKSEPV